MTHQLQDIQEYIEQHAITPDELNGAYELTFDIAPTAPLRKEVYQCAQVLKAMFNDGFPLNKINELISSGWEYEDSPKQIKSFIESLQISDEEKALILSVFTKKRLGSIQVFDCGTRKLLAKIEINKELIRSTNQELAISIMQGLQPFQTKAVSVTFES